MAPISSLTIAGTTLHSRLFIGTGKFSSSKVMADAVAASGSELVTVAVRRVDLQQTAADSTLSALDLSRCRLLPNTSGARDADEAVRIAKLARAACGTAWVKLEVTPDPNYLLPDGVETLKAAEQLVKLGFTVLPYINADPVLARRLADAGCATVMPLAAPIGSNRGLRTRDQLQIIIAQATVPVVVDAGLGMPSHAAEAIEIGADAVLVNTAIATAADPVMMAKAFRSAVEAAELALRAGPGGESELARPSSPLTGVLRTAEV
jgi:thiazole synthase